MAGSTLMRYTMPSQDASRVVQWSVTGGTEDPGYPVSNLNDYDPTGPAKLLSTSGTFRADASAVPADSLICGVALIHTNLSSAATVVLEGSTAPDFATVQAALAVPIPAPRNNWPLNPIAQLDAPLDLPYWRVVIAGNPVAISIGHIALFVGEQTLVGAQQGPVWTDTIPAWDDVTELDVPQDMDLLTQLRACTIDLYHVTAAQQAAIDDWWFDARGQILPFVFTPDVNVNNCYYMTFAEKTKVVTYRYETPNGSIRTLQIKLKEFGRGMLPTPWLI